MMREWLIENPDEFGDATDLEYGFQDGEKNPAWKGGVTSDMKAYQKKYRERLKAEQVEMFYQIQFHKYRKA